MGQKLHNTQYVLRKKPPQKLSEHYMHLRFAVRNDRVLINAFTQLFNGDSQAIPYFSLQILQRTLLQVNHCYHSKIGKFASSGMANT